VEGDPELQGLNATQIRAIAMMVGERITLIHGVRRGLPLNLLLLSEHHFVASWDWKE
jgi:hypothetical protein